MIHSRRDRRIDFAIASNTLRNGGHRGAQVALHPNWRVGGHRGCVLGSNVARELDGPLVDWCELESLTIEVDWSVKILTFCFWAVHVVFACHYLEIILIMILDGFRNKTLLGLWVNWLSAVPVISKNCFKMRL